MVSPVKHLTKYRLVKQMEWYSFLLPTILCLILLKYVPLFTCIKYSFYKVGVLGFGEEYVGLKNYIGLLSGKGFPRALKNTVILGVYGLSSIPLGFILATALNSLGRTKIQAFFRSTFYLPNVITGISIVMLWKFILMKEEGLLNGALSLFAGSEVTIGWLLDRSYSQIGVTIMSLWSSIGYAMLINLAGLQSIPMELMEAASIDGASSLQRWRFITIPNMVPTFVFLFITSLIGAFSRFSDLYVICGNSAAGKPAYSLQTILMYIYQYSFESPNYGLSSAGSMILFFIVLAVTMVNMSVTGLLRKDE